jgi:hypothetical protein
MYLFKKMIYLQEQKLIPPADQNPETELFQLFLLTTQGHLILLTGYRIYNTYFHIYTLKQEHLFIVV